ncbi:hypothetical protein PNEG_01546 [Pneumocystis murina B123]|uniref:RNase III domain-containing protein n=1 Tax=Pneumocystis murina (strain B123) TaxID=1069680 RepID=M7NNN0_PNEMU|nr:hypothetical protein PNEG_01546 [Pneumocystis murina B123]EMR10283.1 hypothetical protein PNEG_01546 [Pneumocystis murina B123]
MNSFENILKFYSRLFNMDEKEIELFLPRDLLWQTLTHKTYFHGKYPYNEKLAFQGRFVLKFHISLKIVESISIDKNNDIFTLEKIEEFISPETLGPLALEYGILEVLRWKPAYKDIMKSGLLKVASESLCAIVGAIFLHRGGAVTKKFIEEKIFIKNNRLEFNNYK